MRSLVLLFAGIAIVSGVVSGSLWQQLRSERELNAELRAGLDAAQAGGFIPQLPVAATEPVVATAEMSIDPLAATVLPPATEPPDLMQDPEFRKAELAETRQRVLQTHPGLAEELELTPERAGKLYDLLAEIELEQRNAVIPAGALPNGELSPEVLDEMSRARQENTNRRYERLAAAFGNEKLQQFREYEQNRPYRQRVEEFGRTVASLGVPLSFSQTRPLTAIFAAEQKLQREELERAYAGPRSGTLDRPRMEDASLERQEQSNRRIVEAARAHLSARQLEALQNSLELSLAQIRAIARARREQGGAQGN